MNLLANGMSHGDAVTIVVLGITMAALLILDVVLLISLHSRNKKFAKMSEALKEKKDTEKDENN